MESYKNCRRGPLPEHMDMHALEECDFTISRFRFGSGDVLPELRQHYRTLGSPRRDADREIDNAVLLLHVTGGSGEQFFASQVAATLFQPRQPLDMGLAFSAHVIQEHPYSFARRVSTLNHTSPGAASPGKVARKMVLGQGCRCRPSYQRPASGKRLSRDLGLD